MGLAIDLILCRNTDDVSQRAAAWVTRLILDRAKSQERVMMALSGGSTPQAVYRRLAAEPFAATIPWHKLHLCWGDERCVPPTDAESNYRMVEESLLSRVPIPPENVHRMKGEAADPHEAAVDYEERLRQLFGTSPPAWPRFDLVLLGIGTDGHTASLFPGSPAVRETTRWVVAPHVKSLNARRLTMTLPMFNHAGQVAFLAVGREKAGVVKRLAVQQPTEPTMPFQQVNPGEGKLHCFLDASAASELVRAIDHVPVGGDQWR